MVGGSESVEFVLVSRFFEDPTLMFDQRRERPIRDGFAFAKPRDRRLAILSYLLQLVKPNSSMIPSNYSFNTA